MWGKQIDRRRLRFRHVVYETSGAARELKSTGDARRTVAVTDYVSERRRDAEGAGRRDFSS